MAAVDHTGAKKQLLRASAMARAVDGEPGAAGSRITEDIQRTCGLLHSLGADGGALDGTVLGQMHELGGPAAAVDPAHRRDQRSREVLARAAQSP